MLESKITIETDSIRITELEIPARHVADFCRCIPEKELALTLVRAMEVGTLCLERARTSQDLEFVRKQVAELLSAVSAAVSSIPAKTESAISARIGTNEGQVLAPLRALVDSASNASTRRVDEVKMLLTSELDPSRVTSVLGSALQQIRQLLDPNRRDSIQASLIASVNVVSARNGAVASTVKLTVEEAMKPLREEIDRLAKEIRGDSTAAEIVQQTTLKGGPYEIEIAGLLQTWAHFVGAEVHHVGTDNDPGDILVKFRGDGFVSEPLAIIVEVRDRASRQMGRKAITDEMNIKLAQRDAAAGVYLSRTEQGLSKREIGEWAEGVSTRGPWIACTHAHLVTAIRFLIVQERLSRLRKSTPDMDLVAVENQIKMIQTSIGRVKTYQDTCDGNQTV
jgi:DNA-binding transcriptional MerR regulator